MNKKLVVLGGGTGQSVLLKGLKQFPFDITAVVSVCDDGKSTGKIREEFNIPAVGDIRRVLIALAETEDIVEKLVNYRFCSKGDFDGHTVGNLILAALTDIGGNLSSGIKLIRHIRDNKKITAAPENLEQPFSASFGHRDLKLRRIPRLTFPSILVYNQYQ